MSDILMELPLVDGVEPTPRTTPAREGRTPTARSVYVETYGCQMNVADSETVTSILGEAGFRLIDAPEAADIILINTCAIR
jgi:tRNA-2-methylthio-N6-dimethylallyladenosine synthase